MKNLIELKEKTLVDMKTAMDELTEAVANCAKAQNDGENPEVVKALKKETNKKLGQYNSLAATAAYLDYGIDDGPEAIKKAMIARYLPGIKRVTYKADKAKGVIVGTISTDLKRKADLIDMFDTIGEGYFRNDGWFSRVEKLAYLMAVSINKDLTNDPTYTYNIKEASMAFNFAHDANPTSENSRVKALQATVDCIVFDETKTKKGDVVNAIKTTKYHWQYIRECMTGYADVGNVGICNTTKFAEYIGDVIHCILTGKQVAVTNM